MQPKSLFILGRQPAIGKAELESLFGPGHLQPVGDHVMVSDIAPEDIPFARLGGSIRLARVLARLDTVQWPALMRHASQALAARLDYLPEGKIKLGLSSFGLQVSSQHLFKSGLELKKVCKKAGRSVRLVPNTEAALSSAQVLHNQLSGDLGIELLLVSDGTHTWLAQTVQVQDITAYARRDQGRPKRDARVGMLPPKLAQTIVNLAVGQQQPSAEFVVLDPFSGTGVVLQEALLMGYSVMGSDIDPRMGEYTIANLDWLWQIYPHTEKMGRNWQLGDATSTTWETSKFIEKKNGEAINVKRIPATINAVASEVYLGRPLSSWPNPETLPDIIGACNVITEKFLHNIAAQITAGTRLCLAVPAWKAPNGRIYHLPLLDHLEKMGYNRLKFEHAQESELVYSRPEQFVARELLVITRK